MQDSNVTLRVYVSGYPPVTSDQIHWYRPNGTEILEDEAVFGDGRKSVVLIGAQASDAGVYQCDVTTSYGSSSTAIQLDVYGMKDSSDVIVYTDRWERVSLRKIIQPTCY